MLCLEEAYSLVKKIWQDVSLVWNDLINKSPAILNCGVNDKNVISMTIFLYIYKLVSIIGCDATTCSLAV